MAKADMVRKTTTVERLSRDGDPIAGKLREGMKEFARTTVEGYVQLYWATLDDSTALLDVFKRVGGQFMKKGQLEFNQTEPEEIESFMVTTWGPGQYQLRPRIGGKYYGPSSVPYKLGDAGEDDGRAQGGDGTEELIGKLAIAKQLKEIKDSLLTGERKEEDGMKATEVQAMMAATMAPVTAMLESANRRAEAAEQRNHDLQMKLLDMAQNKTTTGVPIIGDLLKLLPKEALTALLSPPESPGWMEHAVSALREFGPALTQIIMEQLKGRAPDAPVVPALTPGDVNPQPTEPGRAAGASGGNGAMPLTLNEEQQEAKKLMLECIRERDYANAYAMLETFPGFVPTHQGPMPIGPAFLGMVDPKVTRPRVYVIQMMQLIPELRDMLPAADAFVEYIQKRLMEDQEAAIQEERESDRRRAPRDAGPRPTGGERREEDDRG